VVVKSLCCVSLCCYTVFLLLYPCVGYLVVYFTPTFRRFPVFTVVGTGEHFEDTACECL
jgi:hypothetical protein